MRALVAVLALGLLAAPAFAANPKVEAAIKTFKAIGANPAKLRTYCAMAKVIERMGEKGARAVVAAYLAEGGSGGGSRDGSPPAGARTRLPDRLGRGRRS